MTRYILAGVGFWFVVTGFAGAQEEVKPRPGTPGVRDSKGGDAKSYRGTIFAVTSKTGKKLTIAGSVHMLRKSDHPLPASYEKAFEEASTVVFEVPPSQMSSPKNAALIQKSAIYTDGTTLKDHLSEKTHARLQELIDKKGVPIVPQMRPWLVTQMLGLLEFNKQGFSPQFGVDFHYEQLGIKQRKEIFGLETLEFQLKLFTSLGDNEQEALLAQTMEDLGEAEIYLNQMMDSWRSGDTAALSKVLNEAMLENPKLGKAMLFDRNKNWLSPIEDYLASDQQVMIIVGAGHLAGKGSVIDMLEKKGYKVKQL